MFARLAARPGLSRDDWPRTPSWKSLEPPMIGYPTEGRGQHVEGYPDLAQRSAIRSNHSAQAERPECFNALRHMAEPQRWKPDPRTPIRAPASTGRSIGLPSLRFIRPVDLDCR